MTVVPIYDAQETSALLPIEGLIDAVAAASVQHDAGAIRSPVRGSVPLDNGNGVLLSMPASADDIAIHKLVSICPGNAKRTLPTIFGTVSVCNGETGQTEFILDGVTVTGRRTAAVTMLGVRLLHPSEPRAFLLIGTGGQAFFHALAIRDLYPEARIFARGHTAAAEELFRSKLGELGVQVEGAEGSTPQDADTVIALTTSRTPVYSEDARTDRLVVGVGSFMPDTAEIAAHTVRGSRVFVDDLGATRAEAGDLLQADIDWSEVRSIGAAVKGTVPKDRPIVLKTVGSGAWDLAACRVARKYLKQPGR